MDGRRESQSDSLKIGEENRCHELKRPGERGVQLQFEPKSPLKDCFLNFIAIYFPFQLRNLTNERMVDSLFTFTRAFVSESSEYYEAIVFTCNTHRAQTQSRKRITCQSGYPSCNSFTVMSS